MDDVTTEVPVSGLRARAGRLLQRVMPDLDERAYFRARAADVKSRSTNVAYEGLGQRHPLVSSAASHAHLGRPVHVVVVPHEGDDFESWAPGTRNFYYEAAQSLREQLGDDHVSVFHVHQGEPYEQWHVRLIDYLFDTGATHLLTHIESDPGSGGSSWTWDSVWDFLAPRWDGVLLGVMFDSAYRFINAKSKFLARMSDRFVVVDICMPMDGSMKRGRPEVGPVNMPMSNESLALVDERLASVEPEFDVSFIGVLYPYRVELLDSLRAMGYSVAVNPHRGDSAADADATRVNQPSWLDYMAGLASSKATINFSQSSARPVEQLKTRVLEAGLAGTLLLTDDVDRTARFWVPEQEYGFFASVADLPLVVDRFLADPAKAARARLAFAERSRFIAQHHFWGGIETGLRRRRLPGIGVAPFPLPLDRAAVS